jgi:hypothetical protein
LVPFAVSPPVTSRHLLPPYVVSVPEAPPTVPLYTHSCPADDVHGSILTAAPFVLDDAVRQTALDAPGLMSTLPAGFVGAEDDVVVVVVVAFLEVVVVVGFLEVVVVVFLEVVVVVFLEVVGLPPPPPVERGGTPVSH